VLESAEGIRQSKGKKEEKPIAIRRGWMPEKKALVQQPWFWLAVATLVLISIGQVPIAAFGWVIYAVVVAQRRKRVEAERLEVALADVARRRGFTPTRKFASISVDETHQLWGCVAGGTWRIYQYADIVNSELIENGDHVQQGGASLGRAVVGGMLFGPLGAAVGSMTGAKQTNRTVHTLQVKVTVNDLDDPVVFIDMLSMKGIKASTPAYRKQFEDAQRVLSAFSVMQSQAARPVEENDNVGNVVEMRREAK
jgi:hypothetical protein